MDILLKLLKIGGKKLIIYHKHFTMVAISKISHGSSKSTYLHHASIAITTKNQ